MRAVGVMRATMVLAIIGGIGFASAQAPPPRHRFEVASIKPQSDITPPRAAVPSADRFYRSSTTLADLVNYAWDMRPHRIVGGPDWTRSERWEVNARAADAPDPAVMRAMVQRLLEDRFRLKWHLDRRELRVYRLVRARADGRLGQALKPAAFDCRPYTGSGPRPAAPPPINPRTGIRRCLLGIRIGAGVRTMTMDGVSLSRLSDALSVDLQRHVIDQTGLSDAYDIELTYLDETSVPPGQSARPDAAGAAPLLTAVREQLGLKLEAARGPVDVFVIDAAERAISN